MTDKRIKWNSELEDFVKENYNINGSSLENVIPFTGSAIRNKAKRLGIRNKGHFHNVVKTKMPALSQVDMGYIAGFMDGEGSITYSMSAFTRTQHRIQIGNSNPEVISWIHGILGIGVIRVNKARKNQHLDSYVLNLERQGDVWGFLVMIYPYLRIKQLKAISVIEELEHRYMNSNSSMISGG